MVLKMSPTSALNGQKRMDKHMGKCLIENGKNSVTNFSRYDGPKLSIATSDLSVVKEVMIAQFTNFPDRQVCVAS
jgi:hypothetical protein